MDKNVAGGMPRPEPGTTPARLSTASRIVAARALRDFADAFVALLLPVYLLELGFGTFEVGVIATGALLGSALLTLYVGFHASRHGHRTLLIAASGLMLASGFAFAGADTFWVLLLVAFGGTINPSAGNVSIFVPLEHAVLSGEARDADRTALFARYSLYGALAGAVGSLGAALPEVLEPVGLTRLEALKAMFALYGLIGLAGGIIHAGIPRDRRPPEQRAETALGPSRSIVYKLTVLFSLDSFAGGFVVQSLLALWLFERFDMALTTASIFFFWSGVLSAFSFPVAARIAGRFGLINTMVFTHIPASLCLILAAFAPSLPLALTLLLIRAFLSQMDVPTRSSYVMAVVTAPERPAAASFTALPRSLAAAISPALAGALLAQPGRAWPFLICGVLKIAYDLLLLRAFRHIKPPEEG